MADVTLSTSMFLEKNSTDSSDPFLILVKIVLTDDDATTIRIAYNNEDVEWDGYTWQAFAFEIDEMGETAKAEVPSVALRVDNTSRALQRYVEMCDDGGVGSEVTIYIVHSTHLDEGYVCSPLVYQCTGCKINHDWATFTLGAENPIHKRFPRGRVIGTYCRWRFKGDLCLYSGDETSCNKTLSRCRELDNSGRFGGFPGIASEGVYV
jgi:phage-related protein